ncbi:hypothetical protein [Deinococcus sp. Marseille-Q6407]|uniref:hypothetical protein n=1 Tax=Deinococcus sp. Marseille-Q6407 TaxID=2969223 RepID=UPI0021C2014E|nr:hypothetical protein [Deinococcus sp. Marseille-Q6407]
MKAKAALFLAALALPLSACGTVGNAGPSAGELLRAPTSLNLAGRTLTADARPTLNGEELSTQVKIHSSASSLPLNAHSVYLVTQGGVWRADARWQPSSCGAGCRAVLASGPAEGLLPGENVQLVVRLQDSSGRNFWLRDQNTAVVKD